MGKLLKHPVVWGIAGLIIGAKMSSTVSNLPVVNKIPSR